MAESRPLTPKEQKTVDCFIAKFNNTEQRNSEAETKLRKTLEANIRSPYTGWAEIIESNPEEDIND